MDNTILELDGVTKRFDKTVVADNLSLTVDRGEFFTFLGPSGSGKSTTLRFVAGLESPDSGRIFIQGKEMKRVPPWKRNVGMVFQQYAIFPHMTVAENVAYGLKVRGTEKTAAVRKVDDLLAMVGLPGMGGKNATLLSGGEQQRVALARSLAPEPAILLLDEPLSALDEKIRREMQGELKRIQRSTGTTFLYVTHDQEEALTMSDCIAVLNLGKAVQVDRPEAIFRRPKSRFVAAFFRGCNLLTGSLVSAEGERATVAFAGTQVGADRNGVKPAGGIVHLALRAETISVGTTAAQRQIRLQAMLHEMIYRGTNIDYALELPDGQRLVATSTRREVEGTGSAVTIGFDETDLMLLAD